jgi:hypothetical protein
MNLRDDRGIAALWFAITIVFILGVAALSVDAGGFFSRAYDEQRSGDFACLSGVVELPDDPAAARTVAAGYLATNLDIPQPSSSNGFEATSDTWDLRPFGKPWVFDLDPTWGTPTQMKVRVTKYEDTKFGKALGSDQVRIDQTAYCELSGAIPGGIFPVGVSMNFNGGLIKFSANDCSTDSPSGPGQCDYIDIPRFDDPLGTGSSSAPRRLEMNIWLGANQPLATTGQIGDVFCGTAPSTSPCSVLEMGGVAGNKASIAYQGLIQGDADGSSSSDYLGHLEFGAQPEPMSTRTAKPWTSDHASNVWNSNMLHHSAICKGSDAECAGDNDPMGDKLFLIDTYDCSDRRFVWLPMGDFVGSGAAQHFYIRDFLTAYLVDPIPADTSGPGGVPDEVRDVYDADPISGNMLTEISAIAVDLTDATFMYGSQNCPTSPFLYDELQPVIPRLIEP